MKHQHADNGNNLTFEYMRTLDRLSSVHTIDMATRFYLTMRS